MLRPRRQAAVAAVEKMQRIREWEEMPETSKRFRECAAAIEEEFRAEVRHKHVRAEDIESDDGEQSSEEYASANESFVSSDCESDSSEYVPDAAETTAAEQEEEEEDSCSAAASESEIEPAQDETDSECADESEQNSSECADESEQSSSEASNAATVHVSDISQASTSSAETADGL